MKGNLTRAGLLTAVGLIAAWLESLILPPMPVPGAKVGRRCISWGRGPRRW